MKKVLTLMAVAFACQCISAQDLLVKKTGEIEKVKVVEITSTEVKYKKFSNLEGPLYTENKTNLLSVQYQNGETEKFSTATPISVDTTVVTAPVTTPQITTPSTEVPKTLNVGNYFDSTAKEFGCSFDVLFGTWGSGDNNGMWRLGLTMFYNFNKYVAYYCPLVSFMASLHEKVGDFNTVTMLPVGVRVYSPAYQFVRGYASLAVGVGCTNTKYASVSYSNGKISTTEKTQQDWSFGLDFGVGIQVSKYITLGYNLTYLSAFDEGCSHWFKLTIEGIDCAATGKTKSKKKL